MGTKILVKKLSNKINGKSVDFREGLTKRDRDLTARIAGLGLVTYTNNCVPQVMVKTAAGSRKHNVVNKQDADEKLETRKFVVENKSYLKENITSSTNSKR